jgi:hypothetical protein
MYVLFFFKNEGIGNANGAQQEETKISARDLQSTDLISQEDDVDFFEENDNSTGVATYCFSVLLFYKTIQMLT